MIRFALRPLLAASFALIAIPLFAQEKDFDGFEAVINKAAETKTLEGELEALR
jgi:hypothetical protein